MLSRLSILLATIAPKALSQHIEPPGFNVTEALIGKGVNISAIPALADLSQRSSTSACSIACSSLKLIFGSTNVIAEGVSGYDNFTDSYWSLQQSNVDPYCIFKPTSAAQVSILVLLARLTQCPFAAKSGGHAAFAGGSSIEDGITMSFENMKGLQLSQDKSIAAAEPGWRWGDLYTALAPDDVAVVGGRVYSIGTGGLSTGGGISFFSSNVGWACDNVASYEVVTASGFILTASPTQHSDLYWALRGGGNNFGMVTKFNFDTVSLPGQEMWGGTRTYLEPDFPAVVNAFVNVVADSPSDGNAGQWCAWLQSNGTKLVATELWYAKPNGQNAAIFDNYNAITPIADTTQNRTLYSYAAEIATSNPYGLREVYYCLTVKANAELASIAKDIFYSELGPFDAVAGSNPVLLYQGITVPQIQQMQKRGGNPLGLSASDGALYLIHVACWWENQSDDTTVYSTISTILTKIKAQATELGVQNDYLYMNYASEFEDVISSYGSDNKAKLKSIAKKYDPTGVFQTLQPGYFKLDRAPKPGLGYFSG